MKEPDHFQAAEVDKVIEQVAAIPGFKEAGKGIYWEFTEMTIKYIMGHDFVTLHKNLIQCDYKEIIDRAMIIDDRISTEIESVRKLEERNEFPSGTTDKFRPIILELRETMLEKAAQHLVSGCGCNPEKWEGWSKEALIKRLK